jgi:hypothetical protein
MQKFVAFILLFVFSSNLVANNLQFHFCHGELTDVLVMGEASCICPSESEHDHELIKEDHCCHKASDTIMSDAKTKVSEDENDCCETRKVEVSNHLLLKIYSKDENTASAILLLPVSNHTQHKILLDYPTYKQYQPPSLAGDILVKIQCFRI